MNMEMYCKSDISCTKPGSLSKIKCPLGQVLYSFISVPSPSHVRVTRSYPIRWFVNCR